MDKVRGPNSNLAINGLEAQNENKHSSPDKIERLQLSLSLFLPVKLDQVLNRQICHIHGHCYCVGCLFQALTT